MAALVPLGIPWSGMLSLGAFFLAAVELVPGGRDLTAVGSVYYNNHIRTSVCMYM